MSSGGDVYACFDLSWPEAAGQGFEGTDGWLKLGRIPNGAGVERPFWAAVSQQAGSHRKPTVDFYAEVLRDNPAFARVNAEDPADVEPFWLGLHPFSVIGPLYVSSRRVVRASPGHRFERHPGILELPNTVLLGFRLRCTDAGAYFQAARH